MSGEYGGMTEAEYYRCTCGHGPVKHSFPEFGDWVFPPPPTCTVKGCGCAGYDHITGKPGHLLASQPQDNEEGPDA